jgi:hypothetical protein
MNYFEMLLKAALMGDIESVRQAIRMGWLIQWCCHYRELGPAISQWSDETLLGLIANGDDSGRAECSNLLSAPGAGGESAAKLLDQLIMRVQVKPAGSTGAHHAVSI